MKINVSNLSRSDRKYLDRALELAKLSTVRQKHGALIVKGGRVLSVGINTQRNAPIDNTPSNSYTYHAEHNAIRACNPDSLNGAKIYVARYSRRGVAALSRPCDDCLDRILSVGIKQVIWTE